MNHRSSLWITRGPHGGMTTFSPCALTPVRRGVSFAALHRFLPLDWHWSEAMHPAYVVEPFTARIIGRTSWR